MNLYTGQVNGERWPVDRPCGWNAGLTCPLLPCGGGYEVQVITSRLVVTSAQGINTRPLQGCLSLFLHRRETEDFTYETKKTREAKLRNLLIFTIFLIPKRVKQCVCFWQKYTCQFHESYSGWGET